MPFKRVVLEGDSGQPGNQGGWSYRFASNGSQPRPETGPLDPPAGDSRDDRVHLFLRQFPTRGLTDDDPGTGKHDHNGEGTGTTQPGTATTVPNAAQAYLDELDSINGELQLLSTEMVTVNEGFDADPRTVEFDEAGTRLEAVVTDTQALADRVAALTPPAGLETNQEALVSAIDFCAGAAQDALDGLRSTDTGELRNAAVDVYTTSAAGFDTEVQNAKNAAGATPDA